MTSKGSGLEKDFFKNKDLSRIKLTQFIQLSNNLKNCFHY